MALTFGEHNRGCKNKEVGQLELHIDAQTEGCQENTKRLDVCMEKRKEMCDGSSRAAQPCGLGLQVKLDVKSLWQIYCPFPNRVKYKISFGWDINCAVSPLVGYPLP